MDSDGVSAEERFKAIRERLDAATPGNWVASRDPGEDEPWFVASNMDGYGIGCVALWSLEAFQYDYPPQVEQIADDAAFIANAPTDIAFLLDALAQVEAECDALRAEVQSNWTIDGEPQTWKQMYEREHAERLKADEFKVFVSDLDRCEHGRHEGDVCGSCNGPSHGNPHFSTGDTVGFTIYAAPYVMPERGERHRIDAWLASGASSDGDET